MFAFIDVLIHNPPFIYQENPVTAKSQLEQNAVFSPIFCRAIWKLNRYKDWWL